MVVETLLDRYDVTRRLGQGGMGDVWLAMDRLLGREVALKFVDKRRLIESPEIGQILQDEARITGKLIGSPQIVSVLDLLEVDTALHVGPVLIMEFVNGCNVAEWIGTYRTSLTNDYSRYLTALYISLEMTEAVSEAHKAGVLHRDIKPQNVLCGRDGRVRVADFGLGRIVEAMTRAHTVWTHGTPLYSAPEQWKRQRPTYMTDVYQLSATIYHLIAGVPVNEGTDLISLMQWHEFSEPRDLKEHVPSIDPEIARVIAAGLRKDPDDRCRPWNIYDAISTAVMAPLRLHVGVEHCPDATKVDLVHLLDFGDDAFSDPEKRANHRINFPNPLEALREVIAATLMGANCTLMPYKKELHGVPSKRYPAG